MLQDRKDRELTGHVNSDNYRITLDGDWSLVDFYELPHVYAQVYAFNCAFLLAPMVGDSQQVVYVFASYPWRGGYSAVNFYNVLGSNVPLRLRPKVKSIQYASPGFIELTLLVKAAFAVAAIVGVVVKSGGGVNSLYHQIYKGMQERRMMQIDLKQKELELARSQLDFAVKSSEQLANGLGFESLNQLNEGTGNPVATLKILMSYYRRIRTLAEYVTKGKASFPADDGGPPKLN